MTRRQDKHSFAYELRALMQAKDISHRQLGELTGWTHGNIGTLTRGEREPTVQNVEVISKALNVDPTTFTVYRQHLARQEADRLSREIGLEPVLEALRRLANENG